MDFKIRRTSCWKDAEFEEVDGFQTTHKTFSYLREDGSICDDVVRTVSIESLEELIRLMGNSKSEIVLQTASNPQMTLINTETPPVYEIEIYDDYRE